MDLKRKGIEFPTPSDEDLLLVQSRQVCHLITFLLELTTIQPAPAASPVRPASSASSSSASSRGSKVQGPRSPVGPPNRREEQAARLPASGQLTQGQVSSGALHRLMTFAPAEETGKGPGDCPEEHGGVQRAFD